MGSLYRADHVGSLLRPRELLAARKSANWEQLRDIEDRHIGRVLAKQHELGFDIFTDGEFRRRGFMSAFFSAVEGLDHGDHVRSWTEAADAAGATTAMSFVKAKLRRSRPLVGREVAFLRQHSPGAIKLTIPSPNQFPALIYKRGVTDKIYATHSDLLWDIVAIMKSEVAKLAEEGVAYLQIDAPRYSYYVDPKWREVVKTEMGLEPEAALEEAIGADNAVLEAADGSKLVRAVHLCRGNSRGHWYATGGYDPIAEMLFNTMKVDRFLLEYDDERSGTFDPLRFLPTDKVAVLGLVSSKRPTLESVDDVVRRIDQAAHHLPLDNLALSPQCGFASSMEGNPLSEDVQWAKLRVVVEAARQVWK